MFFLFFFIIFNHFVFQMLLTIYFLYQNAKRKNLLGHPTQNRELSAAQHKEPEGQGAFDSTTIAMYQTSQEESKHALS